MTQTQRFVLWGFLALAGMTLVYGAAAQSTSSVGSGLPKGFENRAENYVVQTRQSVRRMDQNISRMLTQNNKTENSAPNPAAQDPQFQSTRTAYLEQRDKVLAMLKDAEQLPTPTMNTKTRIDAAAQLLEKHYEEVIAALK